MQYPLSFSFKILGLAPQIYVKDATGTDLFYVKQKMFKLKEAVTVFRDSSKSEELYKIAADRVLDFSAKYHITDLEGNAIGTVGRKGRKSIWKATYHIFDGEEHVLTVTEENAWLKVLEAVLGQIPLIGMVAGYLINPAYLVTRETAGEEAGEVVYRLAKKPAFFEGKFELEKKGEVGQDEEKRILLSLLMMTLLERGRG